MKGTGVAAVCTDTLAAIAAFDAYMPILDRVCECILAMGYSPSECLIESCRGHDGMVERRLLKVLGEPCFEITTTRSEWIDYKCTVTHAPRLIAWPPYRPMTAPQVRVAIMG